MHDVVTIQRRSQKIPGVLALEELSIEFRDYFMHFRLV